MWEIEEELPLAAGFFPRCPPAPASALCGRFLLGRRHGDWPSTSFWLQCHHVAGAMATVERAGVLPCWQQKRHQRQQQSRQTNKEVVPEQAPYWIMLKTPCSVFSVLQVGYKPKKNGEQSTEQACITLDNFYPKGHLPKYHDFSIHFCYELTKKGF